MAAVIAATLASAVAIVLPNTAGADESVNVPPPAQSMIGSSSVSVPCPSASCTATAGQSAGDQARDVVPQLVTPRKLNAGGVTVKLPRASRATFGAVQGSATPCSSSQVVNVTGGFKIDEVLQGCRQQQTAFTFAFKFPARYHLVQTVAPGGPIPMSAITGDGEQMTLPPGIETVIAITTAVNAAGVNESNTYGFIDAPTAFDALGQPVPTSYTITGTHSLQQTVDWVAVLQMAAQNGDAVFPVTADPEVTFGWCAYVYFSNSDINSVFFVAWVAGVPAAAAYACSVTWADPSVGLTCTFLVTAAWAIIQSLFHTAQSRNNGGIVWKIAYWGTPLGYLYVGSWS
jgi:hypothetical protein